MESELIGRKVPYSVVAEQSVLGAMLIDPIKCVPEIVSLLKAEDFYVPENRTIFETLFGMFNFNLPIDSVTLTNELQRSGSFDEMGGQSYLAQILSTTPTSANFREYAKIVKEKSILRRLAEVTGDIYNKVMAGESDVESLIESAEQGIYSLRYNSAGDGLVHIRSVIQSTYAHFELVEKNGGKLPGLSSGFESLDRVLTGLNNSDMLIVAARPGVGKTSFVLNLALNASRNAPNKKVAIFSLEMGREQLAMRLLSSQALVEFKKLRTCSLEPEEWERVAQSTQLISGTQIYIDDTPDTTPGEIKAKCRRLGDGLGMIIIDYLQLLKSGKGLDNRVQEVAEISRALKIMAKELNVPVLCCAQLSRSVESRDDKRPRLSDLRDSGSIEQDADIIMFLSHPDEKEPNYENTVDCHIAKNRHGETQKVSFHWIGKYYRFMSEESRFDSALPPGAGE
ncbi:MAG: replicative DNA helicase [Clostridia bacterium]|nr:replicative DNA helicase [Clostridia bacterium]